MKSCLFAIGSRRLTFKRVQVIRPFLHQRAPPKQDASQLARPDGKLRDVATLNGTVRVFGSRTAFAIHQS
jgi:hypothetical protein